MKTTNQIERNSDGRDNRSGKNSQPASIHPTVRSQNPKIKKNKYLQFCTACLPIILPDYESFPYPSCIQ
jgi:hypothetical protein